jgi:hypothetical protein
MKFLALVTLGSVFVAVCECQDMTSMMFQAMGMDPPPVLPVMPQTLREHLYPGERQQELIRLNQIRQQKQRYLAYLSAQKQRQLKENPYSAPYNAGTLSQPRENSVFSPANTIRQPGATNTAASSKANPYSVSYQDAAGTKSRLSNPYGASKTSTSRVPNTYQSGKVYKTWQAMKAMRDQPKKIADAKAAGCKLPVDQAAASFLLFNDCRNPASRMVCQAEFLTCMNIGMVPMCCPYGMNSLAMDTINYVNKLQQFVSEMA